MVQHNLASSHYVEPSSLAAERDRIFARTWQYLGPVAAVAEPGRYLAADVAGLKLVAVRGGDGGLRGFTNVCRHRGAQLLADGEGTCRAIRCPYHQWVYDDTGALVATPWFGDDPTFDPADWPLQPIAVDQWRGLLFAAVDPATSLLEQLGDLPAELADEPIETYTPMGAATVGFDANWKIYTDNFVEGYHLPGVHPEFHAAVDFSRFTTTAHRGYVRMSAPPRNGLFYRGLWLWMWPNWTLSLFDGGMNTSRINPLAVDRTEQHYNFWFADTSDAAAPARTRAVEGNLAIVEEDLGICAATHHNYATGQYHSGPLSPRHEQGVAYFQQQVVDALGLAGGG